MLRNLILVILINADTEQVRFHLLYGFVEEERNYVPCARTLTRRAIVMSCFLLRNVGNDLVDYDRSNSWKIIIRIELLLLLT